MILIKRLLHSTGTGISGPSNSGTNIKYTLFLNQMSLSLTPHIAPGIPMTMTSRVSHLTLYIVIAKPSTSNPDYFIELKAINLVLKKSQRSLKRVNLTN